MIDILKMPGGPKCEGKKRPSSPPRIKGKFNIGVGLTINTVKVAVRVDMFTLKKYIIKTMLLFNGR